MLWIRMNESYFHDERTKRQLALLDKILQSAVDNVAIALFGACQDRVDGASFRNS